MNLQTIREPPTALTPAELTKVHVPLQKLLFSATMTNSPEKLASLHLYNPVLYIASKAPEESDSHEGEYFYGLYLITIIMIFVILFNTTLYEHQMMLFMCMCNKNS